MEPPLPTDPELTGVLAELASLEPIFHSSEPGTTRAEFANMIVDDYWEVGASGSIYGKDVVLDVLQKRYSAPQEEDIWETMALHCRKLAPDVYLLTYTLLQNHKRLTRRATIWQRSADGWKIVYHQGTIVQDA